MRIRTLAGIALSLALVPAALAQRGNGGNNTGCINPPLRWVFADAAGDRITSVGGSYDEGTSFFCGGKPDAHLNLLKGSKRRVNFDFSGFVTLNPDGTPSADQREPWMPSVLQPLDEVSLNIRSLGSVREPGVPTRTMMAGSFKGLDSKSYLLRMTPLNDEQYVDIVLDNPPNSPPDVNDGWMTSPVVAVFYAPFTCPASTSCDNPYGMWEVFGYHQRPQDGTVVPPVQIATIYKAISNPVRVGQFSLPFKVTITALAPLPPQP